MKNQDLKSGLFGSIGENMVAFELAKRNWYVYRPYFDTRIDFIAQKFVCKKCLSDWESKHIISCSNPKCENHSKELNQNDFIKTRKCLDCSFIFNKYSDSQNCPDCSKQMSIDKQKKSGQRNYRFHCKHCDKEFTSQTRTCVKCGSANNIEFPICVKCNFEIIPISSKCGNPDCNSVEYALIVRTIQVKSSHEEESGTIGFNFKMQDLVNDVRHFLVVYSRTFKDFQEKQNFWVMSVKEFEKEYVSQSASTLIYQNARLHPPSNKSKSFFDEIRYNQTKEELSAARRACATSEITRLNKLLAEIDVFGKLNKKLRGDF